MGKQARPLKTAHAVRSDVHLYHPPTGVKLLCLFGFATVVFAIGIIIGTSFFHFHER